MRNAVPGHIELPTQESQGSGSGKRTQASHCIQSTQVYYGRRLLVNNTWVPSREKCVSVIKINLSVTVNVPNGGG